MINSNIKVLLLKVILTIILINTNVAYCQSTKNTDTRPNIVFILTDDQRADTIKKYMPVTYKEIFLKGTVFTNHFATTPICGPSRISILTGLYTTEHGMLDNADQEKPSLNEYSIAKRLKDSGYYTGHVGKFHNTSDGKYSPNRKSEYNYWVAHRGGSARYTDLVINENGKFSRKRGFYVTEFWNRKALQFLDNAKKQHKPFFLTLSHNAPHSPALPDKAYEKRYNIREIKDVPSFLDIKDTGKPSWVNVQKQYFISKKKQLNKKKKNIKLFAGKQLATLMSIDDGVKKIVKKLKKLGLYENTVLVFMSDNGLMWGEHCLQSKNNTYEEATRIPLAISYPKDRTLFPAKDVDEITANIDMAPTFADLAGIKKEDFENEVSGISLLDVIKGNNLRDGILLQGSWNNSSLVYSGYHTKDYVYSETGHTKFKELYNIKLDPYELLNLANEPKYSDVQNELQAKLYNELAIHDPQGCHSKICR